MQQYIIKADRANEAASGSAILWYGSKQASSKALVRLTAKYGDLYRNYRIEEINLK